VCRLCRREGEKLFLKGDRCYTNKCAMDRRGYAPGEHGQRRKSKPSEYSLQLREKQKLRRIYGILETPLRNYFETAERKRGVTGENLLQLLERRLDNVVYRLGLAGSRAEARQMVRHGHFTVNGGKVNIPSFLVKAGDALAIKESSRKLNRVQEMIGAAGTRPLPEWLSLSPETFSASIVALPKRDQIETTVKEHLIVEFYSR
jgi:small subunit ribosomal protein S4